MRVTIPELPLIAAAVLAPLATGCGNDQDRASRAPVAVATVESGATTPPPVEPVEPAAPPTVSYADAEAAYHGGRYAEATELFAGYVRGNPANGWGHYMYGLSAWKAGEHEAALAAFDEALRLDPAHRKSLLNSARVLLETSRPREALERIERALSLEPNSGEAQRLLGRARHELGRPVEAIAAYQRALTLDDRDVWAMNNLGLVYIQQSRFEEAVPPLSRAVELRSNAPVFQNNLGTALEGAGHTAAARRAYEAALVADSSYAKASASLTRLGGPVDPSLADSTVTVDLAGLSREFQAEIERWRDTTATDMDSVVTDGVVADSATQQ